MTLHTYKTLNVHESTQNTDLKYLAKRLVQNNLDYIPS